MIQSKPQIGIKWPKTNFISDMQFWLSHTDRTMENSLCQPPPVAVAWDTQTTKSSISGATNNELVHGCWGVFYAMNWFDRLESLIDWVHDDHIFHSQSLMSNIHKKEETYNLVLSQTRVFAIIVFRGSTQLSCANWDAILLFFLFWFIILLFCTFF